MQQKYWILSFFPFKYKKNFLRIIVAKYRVLYNNPSYSRILIGSHLWSIRGQTHRWRQRSIQVFLNFLNLNQSQFFAKHSNQSVRFILYRSCQCYFRACQNGEIWNKKAFFQYILIFYYIKQIDSMLPCVCSVIDHRGLQNVVRTSVTPVSYTHLTLPTKLEV